MEKEAIARIVILAVTLGVAHWVLVPIALESLFARPKVVGTKALWGIAIVSITCLGSLLYLIAYPDAKDKAEVERECCRDNWWDD